MINTLTVFYIIKKEDIKMAEEKRKTHTSSEVKRRYNNKVYSQVAIQAPKELVADFKEACKAAGISQSQVLKEAMQAFIDKQVK